MELGVAAHGLHCQRPRLDDHTHGQGRGRLLLSQTEPYYQNQPQVALSLFQACGNVAVLSILKSHGVDEDLSSMGWV